MQTLEPLILIFGAILIALGSAAITAAWYRGRIKEANRDAWRSAEIFFTRVHNQKP